MLVGQAVNGLFCELPYAFARYRTSVRGLCWRPQP